MSTKYRLAESYCRIFNSRWWKGLICSVGKRIKNYLIERKRIKARFQRAQEELDAMATSSLISGITDYQISYIQFRINYRKEV